MNSKDFQRLLKRLGACEEAVEWASGKDLNEVWSTCERGDWLLWLVGKMAGKENWPSRQQLVLVACACAELSLVHYEKRYPNDNRPRQAIEVARKWVRGEATLQEVTAAAAAAADAADAAYAAYAAYAADAAADAAAAAAYAAARSQVLKQCADIVRSEIKLPLLPETVGAK